MNKEKKLFKVKTGIGTVYVIAHNFEEAGNLVQERFDQANYGFSNDRIPSDISLVATQHFFAGSQTFTGFGNGILPLMVAGDKIIDNDEEA
jgi:hypothetical protein